jgi:two-component system, cell cycle sensor histidine kinase and response regulator CckA
MLKALIVDDHEANVYLLQSVLAANGYRTATAADGQAALDLALADTPDIIISDILMPVMDGFTLCRLCRQDERLRHVPFVFYTATYTDPNDEQAALSAGADLFLVKPLEPELFLERIAEVLDRCRRGELPVHQEPVANEMEYLKEYSAALVRKLEDKVADVEAANRALRIKEFAIESAPSGIVFIDLDGRITYANEAMASLVGRQRTALAGTRLEAYFGGSTGWDQAAKHVAGRGRWAGELATTAGPDRVVSATMHTVTDDDGSPLCRMAAFEDITERERMVEIAQRNQRLASLSLFAAGVAHDFNNLLAGLFGNIELATCNLLPDHPARQQLHCAATAFERARDLTRRLVSFAKATPPSRRDLVAADLIRECCDLALAGSGVTHAIDVAPGTWSVLGDANQLSQVFTNILLNARQAMNDRGVIRVSVANSERPGEQPDQPPARLVCVTITDEGPGIAPEVMPRLFEPLFTTKANGSGLGLATSYAIVQAHGGVIEASSVAESGATFRVVLPAGQAPIASQEVIDTRPVAASPNPIRVLVMDDERMLRELAAGMLRKGGYDVVTAADGAEAVEACDSADRTGRPFGAVILDLTVPGGMDGSEAFRHLSARHPHLPVIMSTGYALQSLDDATVQPAAVLHKPYRMHELLACVGAVTTGGTSRAA